MKGQDFEFEEFQVTEAVGLAFHGFDLVIGALQGAGGDGVVIPGQADDGAAGLQPPAHDPAVLCLG